MVQATVHDEYPPKLRIPIQSLLDNPENHLSKWAERSTPAPTSSSSYLFVKYIGLFLIWLINIANVWSATSDIIRATCNSTTGKNTRSINALCQTEVALYISNVGFPDVYLPQLHSLDVKVDGLSIDMQRVRGILGMNLDPNPDFSTTGQGARIIPEFTTTTIHRQSKNQLEEEDIHVRLPIVVLEDSIYLGDCWEFSGEQGTIGIRLAEPISITSLAVHYIPSSKLSRIFRGRIPKSLVLWGLVQKAHNLSNNLRPAHAFAEDANSSLPSTLATNSTFIALLHLEYMPSLEFPTQSYLIPTPYLASHDVYDVFIVEVTNNWGADSTCLYHLGIHGISL